MSRIRLMNRTRSSIVMVSDVFAETDLIDTYALRPNLRSVSDSPPAHTMGPGTSASIEPSVHVTSPCNAQVMDHVHFCIGS